MSKENQKTLDLSGVSVAAAFAIIGLLILYVWPNTYLGVTVWVGAALVLLGVTGFLVELSKISSTKKYRFDSLGVGFVLLAPAFFGTQFIYESNWAQLIKMSLMTILLAVILFGVYGVIDFLISIFESADNFKQRLIDAAKFLSVVLPSIAAILAAVSKMFSVLP